MIGRKSRHAKKHAAKKHTAKAPHPNKKHTAKKHPVKEHPAKKHPTKKHRKKHHKKHRTRSGYQIHMKSELARLRKIHPGKGMTLLFKMAAENWKPKK